MENYMALPSKIIKPVLAKADPIILPIGTRIKFIKTLADGPDEYSPGNLYAVEGDFGEVTGHGCREGHWVKWDKWEAPFGAEHGVDFIDVCKTCCKGCNRCKPIKEQ